MDERAAQMPVDHIARDPEPLGNIIRFHLMESMENEDSAPPLRKLEYGLPEHLEPRRYLERIVRCTDRGRDRQCFGLRAREQTALTAFPSLLVDAEINGGTSEEGIDRARGSQSFWFFGKANVELVHYIDGAVVRMSGAPDRCLDVFVVLFNGTIEQSLIVQTD